MHCDPHPHNVLVRKHPYRSNKPQIVLLDHGLYRTLTPEFRHNYTRLWSGIVLSDESIIKEYAKSLNAGAMFTLLAAILTMKPWDDVVSDDLNRLKRKNTAGEKQLLKSYAMKYFREITIMLANVPSDLLLVLKTNDCLRHLDMRLGSPVNTTLIIAETIAMITLEEDLNEVWNNQNNDDPLVTKIVKTIPILSNWFKILSRVFGLKFIKYYTEIHFYFLNLFQSLSIINNT